jgi:uncharacterized OsmC-like protein
MNQTTVNVVNGVNLDQLMGTIEVIKNDPEVALFKFRSSTDWINGGHSKTTIQTFYGARQEDTSRRRPFELHGDEPAVLLGEDHGPNAVEAVLHALASCLAVGVVYHASAQGIEIKALNFSMEGELDLTGFLGLSEKVRPGYKQITVDVTIDAEATSEQLNALFDYVRKTSPVLDIIQNPVPVNYNLI